MPVIHLANLLTSLEKGKELESVEEWKKSGILTSIFTSITSLGIVIAIRMGWLDEMSTEDIMTLSGIIISFITLFLAWVQVATTKKLGIDKGKENE